MKKGIVFLVGAGPGDPGLMTLRGRELLAKADVVLYDALVHPGILDSAPAKAEKIFRGSRGRRDALSQERINSILVKKARAGKRVVRLKGGDPFVFGRGGEEAIALRNAGIPFEVVPGVTSAVSVPAYAGIPVTHRSMNSTLTIVTGHEEPNKPETSIDWGNLAANEGTLVFLMGLHNLGDLCRKLILGGKNPETPAAVIQKGTTCRQKTVRGTLATLPRMAQKARLLPPATVVVGSVVGLAPRLDWIGAKPLFGVRVLVTRGRSQAGALSEQLADKGAEVVEVPTIEIAPLPWTSRIQARIRRLDRYDWLVFSSVNAVELFMEGLFKCGKDARDLGMRTACVGDSTAKALKSFGIRADLVPDDYKQEGLIRSFSRQPLKGKRVLLARGREGRELLAEFLERKGALTDFLTLYENRVPRGARARLLDLFKDEGGVDLVTFASSSAVDHFYGLFPDRMRKAPIRVPAAVIGPVTGKTVSKWGGKIVARAVPHTVKGLIEAVERWAEKRRRTGTQSITR